MCQRELVRIKKKSPRAYHLLDTLKNSQYTLPGNYVQVHFGLVLNSRHAKAASYLNSNFITDLKLTEDI